MSDNMYIYVCVCVCVCVCVGVWWVGWEWGWRRFRCISKRDIGQAQSLQLESDLTSVSRAPHNRDTRI